MQSRRWKKLAAGFAQAGAFLALVAKSDALGLADLIDQLDGAVLVKEIELPAAPSALILARVSGPTPTLKIPLLRIRAAAKRWPHPKWLYPALGALLVLAIAGGALTLFLGRQSPQQRVLTAKAVPAPVLPPPRAVAETVHVEPPGNAGDSAIAAAFSVELLLANTAEGANLFVKKNGAALPAAAVSPVPIGTERATWYRVTAGAYTTRNQADSLLLSLRRGGILAGDSTGSVMVAPLALLVDSVPTQGGISDAVRAAVQKYIARGLSVYPLMQVDGGARLYAGAFATPGESVELNKNFRAAGLKPVLVYRTGSTP
jgi:hypothetical protein